MSEEAQTQAATHVRLECKDGAPAVVFPGDVMHVLPADVMMSEDGVADLSAVVFFPSSRLGSMGILLIVRGRPDAVAEKLGLEVA